uniref:Na_Ca_ex domain-containing protein n=2 Tax=Rhodnius prolixus TaxID=13249 RepID=T1IAG6_RHOPR
MALSNSLGASTFDILICLGLPWVLKSAYFSDYPHEVYINSRGIGYSAILLGVSLIFLYTCLAFNRFNLSKR